MLRFFYLVVFLFTFCMAQPEVSVFDFEKDSQTQQVLNQNNKNQQRIIRNNVDQQNVIKNNTNQKRPNIQISSKVIQNKDVNTDIKPNIQPNTQPVNENNQDEIRQKAIDSVKNLDLKPNTSWKLDDIKNITPTDEPDSSELGEIYQKIEPKELDITSTLSMKHAYIYQIFNVKLRVNTKQKLKFDFRINANITDLEMLTQNPEWYEVSNGVYETTIWFEAVGLDAKIDLFEINLWRNDELFQSKNVEIQLPKIKDLARDKNFANIVASDLVVRSIKSSSFDDNNNIVRIDFEVKNANLSLFSLNNNFKKQGIENIKGTFDRQSGDYFAIVPKYQKSIDFNYFNSKSSMFVHNSLKIEVKDDYISTQIDLNPKNSDFEKYKQITIYAIIVLCLVFFIVYRSYYAFLVGVLLIIYAVYDAKPFNDVTLLANSQVQILPTRNSIVFYTSKSNEEVKAILKQGRYTKIMLSDNKIGWVKNENIK